MFTGIIESTAKVLANRDGKLTVQRPAMFDDIQVGSSVCVSGVCLTAVELTDALMRFDMVAETLSKSTLGDLQKGDEVNLERAMSASSRLDGHIVQGHVEGVGEVRGWGNGDRLKITVPSALVRTIDEKGSITVDGVSLTVASIKGGAIEIALVPHTLSITTLKNLKTGDRVNIETDILARTAARR